jgi:hypothetical protein
LYNKIVIIYVNNLSYTIALVNPFTNLSAFINKLTFNVTSARFIAQERALVKWSQLRLFKAKERRGYL